MKAEARKEAQSIFLTTLRLMPSAFMNYGVTGRQQDGAALQKEIQYNFPVREAILFC